MNMSDSPSSLPPDLSAIVDPQGPALSAPEPWMCSAFVELKEYVDKPGHTYKDIRDYVLTIRLKYLGDRTFPLEDRTESAWNTIMSWIAAIGGWSGPLKDWDTLVSAEARQQLHVEIRKWQEYMACVPPPPPRAPFLPTKTPRIRRNRRLSPILSTVAVILISVLGSLYGRDIVNWIKDDSPIPEVLAPILPNGGGQEGDPNSEEYCGNDVLELGEACDGSALGECRDGCTTSCTCAAARSSNPPVGNLCGNGVCDIGENIETCSDDCDTSDLCGENGGVQWQGDVCVCAGTIDQVTVCQDGTKIDNVTDEPCTPDADACRTNDGGGDDGSSGGGVCECNLLCNSGGLVDICNWVDCNGNACVP